MATSQPNFIQHFNTFLEISQKDNRLTGNHISLYVALFSIWNQHFFKNPFQIIREKVLSISHIGSCHTYNKCMRDLQRYGYINYYRSVMKGRPSSVCIIILSVTSGKNASRPGINIETSESKNAPPADADMLPVIKHVNSLNNERGNDLPPIKKNDMPSRPSGFNEVRELFLQLGHSASEAGKFFHHYEANGWLQGGKTRISNWQAAAQKWILNINPSKTLNHDKRKRGNAANPGNLHIDQDKSYSDPL